MIGRYISSVDPTASFFVGGHSGQAVRQCVLATELRSFDKAMGGGIGKTKMTASLVIDNVTC